MQAASMLQLRSAQSGMALVVVMLCVALLSISAVTVTDRLHYSAKLHSNRQQLQQANWYAIGGEALAISALDQVKEEETHHLQQIWAFAGASYPIDGGSLTGQLQDLHHCFNINALLTPPTVNDQGQTIATQAEQQFRQLMQQLELEQQSDQLIDRIRDWIDEDFDANGFLGAEDPYYSALTPSQMTRNELMEHSSEIALMDLESETLAKLRPWICALPDTNITINVNTLPVEKSALLSAISAQAITADKAQELIAQRPDNGWESLEDFLRQAAVAGNNGADASDTAWQSSLTLRSNYFQVTVDVVYYDILLRMRSRLQLGSEQVRVMSREYGELY